MAIYRDRLCPICEGKGFITIIGENSIGCTRCEECSSTGIVQEAITNSERLAELHTPEDQLKFIRGYAHNAKYAGNPLRLLDEDNSDEDLLLWLNKESDELDDYIFENK